MCNKYFEVVVFTASFQCYADRVIDYIDPTGELIQHRFYRPHCIFLEDQNLYIKDLRIFHNVPLKDILIVDNAVYSFGAQLDNGVPITPFKEDALDNEFLHLKDYLELCAKSDDVRKLNSETFQLDRISKHNFHCFIDYYDYEECEAIMKEDDDSPEIQEDSGSEKKPPKCVNESLDVLSKMLKKYGGQLPLA